MRFSWTLSLCLMITACAGVPYRAGPSLPQQPSDFPAADYRRAATLGQPVYQIDPQGSIATVYAYRGGSLAHAGHDHAIASRQVQGYVLAADDPRQARADLYVPLGTLAIDEPDLRASAGFEGLLTPEEIDQTRRHMLDEVLDAQRYPFMTVHAAWAADAPPHTVLDAQVTLHGVTRSLDIPVDYKRDGDRLKVEGRLRIRQSDFGITAYSVLGGALTVKDELALSFRIEAARLTRH
jgi:polyisoprenoid-binding protein YceI